MRRIVFRGCVFFWLGLFPSLSDAADAPPQEATIERTDAADDLKQSSDDAKPVAEKKEAEAAKPAAAPETKTDATQPKTEAAPAEKESEAGPAKAEASSEEAPSRPKETERQRQRRLRREREKAEKAKRDADQAPKETSADPDGDKPVDADASAKDKDKDKKKDAKNDKGGPKKASAIDDEKTSKRASVVQFTIRGNYPEGPAAPGLFGEIQPSLGALVKRMDAAASDQDVRAVWLKIEDASLGRGKLHELRAAVARLRKANKPVYAEITTADGGQYLLAAACERIVMPPSGTLLIPGVRAEVVFYKGLLDKLGLEFDALQMGKYKGAAEPLTRNAMSPPLRESLEALVDDLYEDAVTTIAADRNLKDYQVKTLIDQGLFTAAAAQKAGLVDDVLYSDQFQESLKKKLEVDRIELVTKYKRKRIETDFSGITGMMKMMELLLGSKPVEKSSAKSKIAVVYAVGPIVEGKGERNDFFGGDSVVGSTNLTTALKKADEDAKVAAIVLRIDSPGGSATASDLIWRETVQLKKPLIASMGDVAGSGGYYIAMGAKKIVAAPGTLTGSIGVIGGKLVTRGLFEKLGLNTEVIARGANSGSMSSNQKFTPEERKAWTELLEETYRQFVSKAAHGRKMTYDKLEELAQGRVYSGRTAQRLGLVDELGSLDDAIRAAKEAAGLKPDADVELLVLPEAKTFFEQLFGDSSAGTDLESLLPEGFQALRQSRMLRALLSERFLLWMPYAVEVK